MKKLVIEVRNLDKSYGPKRALEKVCLEVPEGALFGLVGPDGAGKSTLLKIITGLLRFDQGEIFVFGKRLIREKDFEQIKEKICFMPQGLGVNLYQELTVEENLRFFGRLRLLDPSTFKRRKEELLELTGLSPFKRRRAKHLSGGMKQKLAFICSIIHYPSLIVLDEPTTGVDPLSREEFWSLLADLVWQQRATALVSTTYLEEAERFDQLALMHQGQILLQGSPQELLSRTRGRAFFLKGRESLELQGKLLAKGLHAFPYTGGFRVFVPEEKLEVASKLFEEEKLEVKPLNLSLGDLLLALSKPTPLKTVWSKALAQKPGSQVVIQTRGLTKEFGAFKAVDEVDLNIYEGEIYGLLGPNGAGKTTLIRLLCGLLPPSKGSALVAGYDSQRAPRAVKENIGYLSQAFSLYHDLTVKENLWLMAGIYGQAGRKSRLRIEELLELTELKPYQNFLARDLPLGLRQRLALACALIHQPKIVFLDEPTSGMDISGREGFWNLIFGLSRAYGLTCLVTTHYLAEAEHCDRLSLMYQGKMVAQGRPEDLKEDLKAREGTVWMVSFEDLREARKRLKAERPVMVFGRRLRFFFRGSQTELQNYLRQKGLKPLLLEKAEITMEDVFLWHTQKPCTDRP